MKTNQHPLDKRLVGVQQLGAYTFWFAKLHGYTTKYKDVSKRDHLVKNYSQVLRHS